MPRAVIWDDLCLILQSGGQVDETRDAESARPSIRAHLEL